MTMKDIAEAVGVSHTTVSNVINGKTNRVSQETVNKVNEAIKKFNYIPNKNASALANNSSKIIILILPNLLNNNDINNSDPFQSQLLTGIEKYISLKNYYLMVKSIDKYDEIIQLIANWNVDGIIVQALVDQQLPNLNNFLDIPLIFIDTYNDELNNINIGTNDYKGEFTATNHLVENGHTKIGFICHNIVKLSVLSKRLEGFIDSLNTNNISYEYSNNVLEVNDNIFDNKILHEKILAFVKDKTAICFGSDILAIEIMEMLKKNGYRIPEDISIVGFDNLYFSELVTPKLTTINQDIIKKGKYAAESLISMIEKNETKVIDLQLPTNLIIRDSVKKLN